MCDLGIKCRDSEHKKELKQYIQSRRQQKLTEGGGEAENTTISWLSSARQRHTIEMAFRWLADDGPTLNAG